MKKKILHKLRRFPLLILLLSVESKYEQNDGYILFNSHKCYPYKNQMVFCYH